MHKFRQASSRSTRLFEDRRRSRVMAGLEAKVTLWGKKISTNVPVETRSLCQLSTSTGKLKWTETVIKRRSVPFANTPFMLHHHDSLQSCRKCNFTNRCFPNFSGTRACPGYRFIRHPRISSPTIQRRDSRDPTALLWSTSTRLKTAREPLGPEVKLEDSKPNPSGDERVLLTGT